MSLVNTCNKSAYETKEDALRGIKIIKVTVKYRKKSYNKMKTNGKLSVYLCARCNKYHLTSVKQSQKKYKRFK